MGIIVLKKMDCLLTQIVDGCDNCDAVVLTVEKVLEVFDRMKNITTPAVKCLCEEYSSC